MRLYNTATRKLDDLPPPPGPIRMYFCGPTVYQRIHVGNARPFIVSMWLKRWLEHEGYDVTLVENITDINDKIYAAAPGPQRRARRAGGPVVHRGHGRPRPRASRPRAEGDGVDRRDRRADPGARRARARVPGRRRRLLPGRPLRGLRRALGPARRGLGPQPVRGGRAELAQGEPARLRALEGAQGGRGHVVGVALGPRAAPAGTSSARRWPRSISGRCSRSTAVGSTSSSRTTRTRSPSRAARAASSRGCGCTTGCCDSAERRCRSRSATSSRCATRSRSGGGRRF